MSTTNVNMRRPRSLSEAIPDAKWMTFAGFSIAIITIGVLLVIGSSIHMQPSEWGVAFGIGSLSYVPFFIIGTVGAICWAMHGRYARIQDIFKNTLTPNFNSKEGL